jgi:hypothetical protein
MRLQTPTVSICDVYSLAKNNTEDTLMAPQWIIHSSNSVIIHQQRKLGYLFGKHVDVSFINVIFLKGFLFI